LSYVGHFIRPSLSLLWPDYTKTELFGLIISQNQCMAS
jgi:hypothetical protein